MPEPTVHTLATALAVLEERMNTQQANYEAIVQTIRADIQKLTKEAIKREATRDKWLHGILISLLAAVIAGTIVGIILILAGNQPPP
ncbi:MAG: hypothetical protein GDA55_01110 [Cellvibrionales bacterium]|nr:hypothetical protein [Cellvibrionales bacterium]